ncbi:GNAT family N-acetyltransferase [Vibrio sp. AK197]
MSPDYQIVTPRLCLKLIDSAHSEQLQACVALSPSLHRWVDWCVPNFTALDAEHFIVSTRLNWVKSSAFGFGVFRRCDDQLLGMVAINEFYHTFNMASIGYWIADEFQLQGYAKEAVEALTEFCFGQLKLSRLEIVCDPENQPSQIIAKRCGAEFEALARNRYLFNKQPRDGMVYAIIPS